MLARCPENAREGAGFLLSVEVQYRRYVPIVAPGEREINVLNRCIVAYRLGLKLVSGGLCCQLSFILNTLPFSGLVFCVAPSLQCSCIPKRRLLFCDIRVAFALVCAKSANRRELAWTGCTSSLVAGMRHKILYFLFLIGAVHMWLRTNPKLYG